MNIRHCLFWFQNNTVTAILKKNTGMEIMKFRGNETIPFTESYWNDWIEYSGLCRNDKTDFCLIYDIEPTVSEKLLNMQCESASSFWNRIRIQKVLQMLEISASTEIRLENGELLCRTGSSRKADMQKMTAKFMNADLETAPSAPETVKKTELIQYYVSKLKEYKESYNT